MAIATQAGLPLEAIRKPAETAPQDVAQGREPKSAALKGAQAHVAWIVERSRGGAKDERGGLLVLRFLLLNMLGAALVGLAWVYGLVAMAWEADGTGITPVIVVVFVAGLALCGLRIWQTSTELDRLRSFDALVPSKAAEYLSLLRGIEGEGRGLMAATMRLKLTQRIAAVRHIANSLVVLGLIGTVVGFVIALSGIDPQEASDVSAIAPMVSTMIEGMSTALFTTLIGAVLNLWLLTNYQLLATGTVKLITGLVEFGEIHGRT